MTHLDSDTDRLLRALLGEGSSLLPFARGVVGHLAASTGADTAATVAQVVGVLRPIQEEGGASPDLLASEPMLLASFFQNADLLEPMAPDGAAVARAIVSALESLDPGAA